MARNVVIQDFIDILVFVSGLAAHMTSQYLEWDQCNSDSQAIWRHSVVIVQVPRAGDCVAGAQNMWILFLSNTIQSSIFNNDGRWDCSSSYGSVLCGVRTHVRLNDGNLPTSDRPWHLCTSDIFFADIWHTDLGPRIKTGGDPGPKFDCYFPVVYWGIYLPPSGSSHLLRLPFSLNIFSSLPWNSRTERSHLS